MERNKTNMLVEGGILIAMSQILSYFKVAELPYEGSVTAGSMVPIIVFAIRWGVKRGIFAAAIYGVLQFLLDASYTIHWLSILVDYPVAFGFLGLAGLFRKSPAGVFAGTALGIFGRFAAHFFIGIVVFGQYAPEGQSVWAYSLGYNATYMIPEFIITFAFIAMLYKFVIKDIVKKNSEDANAAA